MKKLLFVCAAVIGGLCSAANVTSVEVRQDWPWSKSVNVIFTVEGAPEAGVDVSLTAFDGEKALGAVTEAMLTRGSLFAAKNGRNVLAIDPDAFGGTASSYARFAVEVETGSDADPLIDRIEYRVCDLETGKVTDLTRRAIYGNLAEYGPVVTNYSEIGEGYVAPLMDVFIAQGFNKDVYKTTKLVLKRIPAKGVVWTMGPADSDDRKPKSDWTYPRLGESAFAARFTSDYYIAIFELTQEQYLKAMKTETNPSFYTVDGATRPLENVSYPEYIAEDGFQNKITALFGKSVLLPTEAQWEFAARAGTDGSSLPNGQELTVANVAAMEGCWARNRWNEGENPGPTQGGTYKVGGGKPNAYGLYDTLANVSEWVRDQPRKNLANYYKSTESNPKDDPAIIDDWDLASGYHVYKGASFCTIEDLASDRPVARYADQDGKHELNGARRYGFRVMCPAE